MSLGSRFAFGVAVMALSVGCTLVPPEQTATKPAEKIASLTITLKDNGRTVKAAVGQEIVVSLEGKEARTGWEANKHEGKSVEPVKEGGSVGDQKTPRGNSRRPRVRRTKPWGPTRGVTGR